MQTLDRIIALTDSVEQHVERGEWTEASALDTERCRLLTELFSNPAASTDLAAHREVLQNLLMRNRQTARQVETRKLRLVQASGELRNAGGALHAYGRNTGGSGNPVYLREPQANES